MHSKKLYGTATVGTKGQVVIPAEAREEFNIKTGDRLYVVGSQEHKWIGFLTEDQLRQIIDRVTSDVESYKNIINKEEN